MITNLNMHSDVVLLEIRLYQLQQLVYRLLSSEIHRFSPLVALLTFTGGLVTSLNPCMVSMLPVTLSYMKERGQISTSKNAFLRGLSSSIILTVLFTLLIGKYYHKTTIHIPLLSPICTVLIGLNLLEVLHLNYFARTLNVTKKISKNYKLKNYFIGFFLGLNSSSCSTPVLITIIFWLSNSNNIISGIIYICCYLFGYILLIFLLLQITIKNNNLKPITKLWYSVVPAIGCTMTSLGVFSLLAQVFTQ